MAVAKTTEIGVEMAAHMQERQGIHTSNLMHVPTSDILLRLCLEIILENSIMHIGVEMALLA